MFSTTSPIFHKANLSSIAAAMTSFMKLFKINLAGNISSVVFACCATVALYSCSDDNTETPANIPSDTEAPNINISGLQADATVWNTVILKLTAIDNKTIKEVVVKIDGSVVGTFTASPFEYELDTRKLKDGVHRIAAAARDESGNEKTTETRFTVQNILLSFKVPDNFFPSDYRGFVFLSDEDGGTLDAVEYHPGDSVKLQVPDFEGADFYMTEVVLDPNGYKDVYTYAHVSRGGWNLIPHSTYVKPIKSEATVDLINIEPQANYQFITNSATHLGLTMSPKILYFNGNESKVFITRSGGDNVAMQYALIPGIHPGQNGTIDMATVNKPFTKGTMNVSAFDNVSVAVDGFSGEDTYSIASFSANDQATLDYGYPEDAFEDYIFSTYIVRGEDEYRNSQQMPDLTTLESTIDISVNDNIITGTVAGNTVDIVNTYFITDKQYWAIYGAKGDQHIIIPQIPAILKTFLTRNLAQSNVSVTAHDVNKINGYEEYINFIRTFRDWTAMKDLQLNYTSRSHSVTLSTPPQSGGRLTAEPKSNTPLFPYIPKHRNH